jgi:acetyl-CoA acyltransferase
MDWQALTYAGHTVWGMHAERAAGATLGGEKRRPRDKWQVQRNTHQALISDDQAETILRQLEQGVQGRRLRASPLLLTGLLMKPEGQPWHSDGCGHYRAGRGRKVAAHRVESAVLGQLACDLASDKAVKAHGLKPLARVVSFANRGVPPEIMGIGPIEAIPAALRYAGLQPGDLGWIELNEAFAAQALAVLGTLKLDPAKVNPLGGAIALGHPLGATGAIRAATVVHALRRHNLKYGMVTMCVGTGQGAAGIFERV